MAEESKVKYMIRVCNTDLDGAKPLYHSLTKIKGIGKMLANAVCVAAKIDPYAKTGSLSDADVKKLNEVITKPAEHKIPAWMLNRKRDPSSGEDMHLLTSDLDFVQSNDKKQLQKIKCYRGVRHYLRLPVRGQRTRSNFRKNKGKVAAVKKKGPERK